MASSALQTQFGSAKRLLLDVREGLVRTPRFRAARRRLTRGQERLERVEAEASSSPRASAERDASTARLGDSVAARLVALQSALSGCEAALSGGGGGSASSAALWARKVETARDEAAQLSASLARARAQHSSRRRASAAEQRSELLRRGQVRARGQISYSLLSPLAQGAPERGVAADFDAEAQVFAAAARNNRGLDELLGSGGAVLQALRGQSETLKGAQRRLFDVLSLLGMSGAVLRSAERRVRADKLLVFGCMALTLGVFGLVVYWKH